MEIRKILSPFYTYKINGCTCASAASRLDSRSACGLGAADALEPTIFVSLSHISAYLNLYQGFTENLYVDFYFYSFSYTFNFKILYGKFTYNRTHQHEARKFISIVFDVLVYYLIIYFSKNQLEPSNVHCTVEPRLSGLTGTGSNLDS